MKAKGLTILGMCAIAFQIALVVVQLIPGIFEGMQQQEYLFFLLALGIVIMFAFVVFYGGYFFMQKSWSPLKITALVAFLFSIVCLLPNILFLLGRPMRNDLLNTIITLISFSRWIAFALGLALMATSARSVKVIAIVCIVLQIAVAVLYNFFTKFILTTPALYLSLILGMYLSDLALLIALLATAKKQECEQPQVCEA